MSEQRLIEIETKISHQEALLEDLNQVICRQQETIDLIETKLKALIERFREGAGSNVEIASGNEKPPHY
jgi:SlyX protein